MKHIISLTALILSTMEAPTATPSTTPYNLIRKRALRTPRNPDQDSPPTAISCPSHLEKDQFEFPHYITQISKKTPDAASGPQYNGVFTPNDVSSIFAFDIPGGRADANCTVEFLFPRQEQLTTSAFTYSGGGTFFFSEYAPDRCPGADTTFDKQPGEVVRSSPPIHMEPGFAYTIDIGPCSAFAGKCVAGMMSSNDTSFNYFQDYNPCPIGLYVSYSYGLPPREPRGD